ncbi:MAG: peptide ABC transporter substrate-binding protein [Acholeplasmataceae bacterium]|jgi:oligopeptide transport system substrate-binding protein|nr:peptide ABC transporter substrate-binding protein [Acholeplasmataceae bacterium]
MKKLVTLLAVFSLALFLVACKTEEKGIPGVLRWNIGADPLTLDPSLNGASDGGDVINNTHEGLVREINGIVYPGIAETWNTSTDGLTVTFNLRQSNWSDGTPLTANDFIYTYRRAMDPATASEYSWIWEYTNVVGAIDFVFADTEAEDYDADELWDAVGITAVNDYTLQFELVNPTSYFVSLMAFYHFMPVKQASVEAEGGAEGLWAKVPALAVCNGPFKLTQYSIGSGLTLEKNEEYWNADVVKLDKIEGKFIDNESTAYDAFVAGELDYIPAVPTSEMTRLINEDDQFHIYPLLGTYYYSFNLEQPLYQNLKLRKALAYAIDREAIVEELQGGQLPAAGFIPQGFIDHLGRDFFETAGTYGVAADDSNFAEAVTLFAEAATEMSMTVAQLKAALAADTLLYNTSEAHAKVAQLVQESWNQVLGFQMSLGNQEWGVFQETRKAGNFDVARGGWLTDFMDPIGMLAIFTEGNAYNDPKYDNPVFDQLISDAQSTTSAQVHFEKLYEAQDEFMGDMPIIPVYHYTDFMYVKSYVEDWGRSVLGTVDFSRAHID